MLRTVTLAAAVSAALVVTFVSAQTPTPTPYGGATTTPATGTPETPTPATVTSTPADGTPTPIVTTTPLPTATPTPISDGGEPSFNYDIVKEIVVPLIGDDGRTHYVTLSEDTAGVVRIRLSLFFFPRPFSHNVVVFDRGDCTSTGSFGPGDVIAQFQLPPSADAANYLVLDFFNTTAIRITGGANSIYDADGTSLAIYRPGSGGAGLLAACAVLAPPLGAPDAGSGHLDPGHAIPRGWLAIGAVLALSVGGIAATGGRHRRRKPDA